MKFMSYRTQAGVGLAVDSGDGYVGVVEGQPGYPGTLLSLVEAGGDALATAGAALRDQGQPVDPAQVTLLPPLLPGKILCVGLNYADHAAESNMAVPEVPTLFSRFAASVVAPGAPIRLPRVSAALDYEGELAVVIGTAGRYIAKEAALDHVAGYAAFNDASIRDYQLRTPQWTIGKNFDGTGPFGPVMVTADALPPGASGLKIETRLDGEVMQKSSTDQLIFDVATLIASISEAMALEPGDVIITGTPAGVGGARKPQRFMRAGEVCEIEIEGIGILSNPVVADA
ncbi:fumarylacetoacetate hydrolase family protein [uncultured Sphingomonas sp.]|uniref:fumarylacetoacetate hydrolase family protein n=1 Tax=uncultured Sphingomonas sp. TaxID=158754 RepID=UPI0035CCA20F